MRRGVGRIVKKVWKIVGGHRRYVGLDAKGRWKFLKTPKGAKRGTKSSRKSNPKRRRKNMGRRKKRRGGKSLAKTVMKWLRIGALVGPGVQAAVDPRYPSAGEKLHVALCRYTGFDSKDGSFHPEWLMIGWGPYLATCLITYGIPKLTGIIRRL